MCLSTPLSEVYGIGPRFLSRFQKLNIRTVADLIRHFPNRYEDFSVVSPIADVAHGQTVTIVGEIIKTNLRRSWRKKMAIVEAQIADQSGMIKAVWFNQPYIKNALAIGAMFNFSGKVGTYAGEAVITNPLYEAAGRSEGTKHTARLVPIYPETKGMTSKGVRFIIKPILANLEEISEFIPDEMLDQNNLPEINEAVRAIHFPDMMEEAEAARRRFAWQELFLLAVANLRRKAEIARKKAQPIPKNEKVVAEAIKNLPFALTGSQEKCLAQVLDDLSRPTPMNRLLQGDVGSGKTAVAAVAAVNAAGGGYQTAFMAPTEVLARQHYRTLTRMFGGVGVKIGLITGGGKGKVFWEKGLESEAGAVEMRKLTKEGKIGILVGTHALIYGDSPFRNLGLAVIDEQHRFGVEQRAMLAGRGGVVPHFLSMSATPIPRTLTLTIFGDLDLSVIDEMPAGRKPVATKIVPPEKRADAYEFIRREVKAGRQIFVICPRIEQEAENNAGALGQQELFKLELKSVTAEFEKLSRQIFPDLRVAMLHGKMKVKEKVETMNKFAEGETDILVATSVVEVGVDVPNATIMMIESAERFGLAQLYQFRGRVGRGEHASYCLLFTEAKGESVQQRLEALKTAKNGFELAEMDLKMRGPGQFLGIKQTGMPDAAMRSLSDLSLIGTARTAAEAILKEDPSLARHQSLREQAEEMVGRVHNE